MKAGGIRDPGRAVGVCKGLRRTLDPEFSPVMATVGAALNGRLHRVGSAA